MIDNSINRFKRNNEFPNVLANISQLRRIGTTSYMKYIKDTKTTGVVKLKSGTMLIRHLPNYDKERRKLTTITDLLRFFPTKGNAEDFRAYDQTIFRAETALLDYRNNLNPEVYQIEYLEEETEVEEIDNTIEYEQVAKYYSEVVAKMIKQYKHQDKPTEETEEPPTKSNNTKGKIIGF